MKRILLIFLLAIEGVVLASIVMMIGGLLPTGDEATRRLFWMIIWLSGVFAALAVAIVLVFPEGAGRGARHGGLIAGSAVFMLPFLWLVGTSLKQPEETLIFPPRWIPKLAAAPKASPWTDEAGEHSVRLGAVSVRDQEAREEFLQVAWKTDGAAELSGDVVRYDFGALAGAGGASGAASEGASDRATVVAEFDVPFDIVELTLRMRQDDSWHAVTAALETAGRRYETTDWLHLGVDGWREWTFRLPAVERRDQRFAGIWQLTDAGASDVATGRARLALHIVKKSRTSATFARWTQSYRDAWYYDENWGSYLLNSVWIVVLSVIGQVLSCSMAAYAFARLRWPGRDLVFGIVLATMMLPMMVVMVPQFLIFKSLGWYNTLLPLWAPAFLGTPFFIFLLRQFMLGVPRELEEAARIDGCSWLGIYWRIMLPLLKPALAAVAIFTFMNAWNDFMAPLIYLNDQRLYPLSLGLFVFRGAQQFQASFTMLMAASTLMTLPVIAIFFLAQRYFIEGVTLTGMKA